MSAKKWLWAAPLLVLALPAAYGGMLMLTMTISTAESESQNYDGCPPTWNPLTQGWEYPGGGGPQPSPTAPQSPAPSSTLAPSPSTTPDGAGGSGATTPPSSPGVISDDSSVAGYNAEQLTNAAFIMSAATSLNLGTDAQIIGVMTAMGESSLINIDYGDNATNPDGSIADSMGLYQQQKWKGTVEERMDPTTSATIFYTDLVAVDGWQTLEPTIAAHRAQNNSDPYHYEPYYDPAVEVVSWLSGQNLSPMSSGGGTCGGPAGNYDANGSEPGPWGGYSNGEIAESELVALGWEPSVKLRKDAAEALTKLNDAYKAEFGSDLPINDGYRDLAGQIEAKEQYGDEAAEPGTSIHGWALAVDVGTPSRNRLPASSKTFTWLTANAGKYGWVNPPWALSGGVGPYEPWHWEFWGVAK